MSAVVVLPEALLPYEAADVSASVAQPSPAPTNPSGELQEVQVSPGLLGFLPPFLIALACVGLFLSLTRHLRRVSVRQALLDASDDDPGRRPGGGAPTGGDHRPDAP